MNTIKLPTQAPDRRQLELPVAQLSGLASDVSKRIMTIQLEILGVQSAEDLAIAINKFHVVFREANATWSTFADQASNWGH